MSEKVTKWLRNAVDGKHLTRRGMHELRRLYYNTPRPERAAFSVDEALKRLAAREVNQRQAVAERVQIIKALQPALRRRRRRQFLMAPFAMLAATLGMRRWRR